MVQHENLTSTHTKIQSSLPERHTINVTLAALGKKFGKQFPIETERSTGRAPGSTFKNSPFGDLQL